MPSQTIMIIRHGEKPDDAGITGVDESGTPDSKSLTPRGWQRAGGWTEIFSPSLGLQSALPRPTAIFASAPATHEEIKAEGEGSKSQRPLETVSPLAARLEINVTLDFGKGNEVGLAGAISKIDGVVLVCWQHEDIAAIASALTPKPAGVPQDWPGDRFNVVYRFDRPGAGSPWIFSQIVPVMLVGDSANPIVAAPI